MQQTTITAITTPDQVLADATAEQLLDSIVRLTHRIHGLKTTFPARADELRMQRALIRTEVLRRIAQGGAR